MLDNAQYQLCIDITRAKLQKYIKDTVFKKVIACPQLEETPHSGDGMYIDLCMNHLSAHNFDNWWEKFMIRSSHVQNATNIYDFLIPRLLCRRRDICIPYAKIYAKLDNQQFLEKLECRRNNPGIARTSGILKREWLYLTSEQSKIWRNVKQVICGPYGSGKTVLIQCKAADILASSNCDNVLVVVPSHLKLFYKNFFKKNGLSEKSNLFLISRKEFYKKSQQYIRMAHSSHVFVDELLWPYEADIHIPLLETVSRFDGNEDSHMLCEEWSLYNRKFSYEVEYDIGYEFEEPVFEEIVDDTSSSSSHFWYSESSSCTYPEENNPFPCFENLEDELYLQNDSPPVSNSTYHNDWPWDALEILIKKSTMDNNPDSPNILFLKLLEDLLTNNNNQYHVWVAPHLYKVVAMALNKLPRSNDRKTSLSVYLPKSDEVYQFITMCKNEKILISKLKTVMRTTKQINDYKIEKEWEDFCHTCDRNKNAAKVFLESKFFKMAFENYCGHAISGPSVKTITYPTHCHDYGDYGEDGETHLRHFHRFAATVIEKEIGDLLKDSSLQPQHIIVIGDYNEVDLNLSYIKELLHKRKVYFCSLEEQQEGANQVTMCNSRHIASLEWPVVIHIKPSVNKWVSFEDNMDELKLQTSFFDTDYSVITSRCMVQYILICQKEDDFNSHEIFLSYNLDTDQGKIRDLPTLLAKNAKPTSGAFEKVITRKTEE